MKTSTILVVSTGTALLCSALWIVFSQAYLDGTFQTANKLANEFAYPQFEPASTNTARPQQKSRLDESSQHSIAYVTVVTGCVPHRADVQTFPIAEAAAVLHHSIATASKSYQNFSMYAIYHPEAASCTEPLAEIGYKLLKRETPVVVDQIQGEFLRTHVRKNGCCGEKELLKLEAFTLTDHSAVVLLDLDALILQPLDALFDLIIHNKRPPSGHLMRPEEPLPAEIDILHTIDYAMLKPNQNPKAFQGGFAVLKPNIALYDELVSIVLKGDFRPGSGWGGSGIRFWGAQTFQGLMPFMFHVLHPGRSVEMHWCTYNNMCSPSRNNGIENNQPKGLCFTGEKECEDCRLRSIDSVISAHMTVCGKPWVCKKPGAPSLANDLCTKFHHAWFEARSSLEKSWGRPGKGPGEDFVAHNYGFCSGQGLGSYHRMEQPYGPTH